MSVVRFASFFDGPTDRGSIQPLFVYEADLPVEVDPEAWLNEVIAGFKTALKQVVKFDRRSDVFVDWFSTLEEYISTDSDFEELFDDNSFEDESVRSVSTVVEEAARKMVEDVAPTPLFDFHYPFDPATVDWAMVWDRLAGGGPQPVRIPVGERVYGFRGFYLLGPLHYGGLEGDDAGDVVFGPEEEFVPVSFVESRKYGVEAFPVPRVAGLSREHAQWWARVTGGTQMKGAGRLEGLGGRKSDAIKHVTALVARKEFWE